MFIDYCQYKFCICKNVIKYDIIKLKRFVIITNDICNLHKKKEPFGIYYVKSLHRNTKLHSNGYFY